MGTRRVVDAKADSSGNISHVKLDGGRRFTPVDRVIPAAERGEIVNVHVVHREGAKPFLRSNPDDRKGNNLDEMAGDHK